MQAVDRVGSGVHAYAPRSAEGLPLRLDAGPGFKVLEPLQVEAHEGRTSGQMGLLFSVRGAGDELVLSLQLCDSLSCQMPQTLALQCPVSTVAS